MSCAAGTKSEGAGCVACDKGSYCQGGVAVRCSKNDDGYGTWNNITTGNSTSDCLTCPNPGTICTLGDTIEVAAGYYVYGAYDSQGYACAMTEACVGGNWLFGGRPKDRAPPTGLRLQAFRRLGAPAVGL